MCDSTRQYTFPIIIEKELEDPGYFAHSPLLPGCFSDGLTVEETLRNMRDAIELHVGDMLKHGESIPQSADALIVVKELTLGIPA
jgi:predicted RNase H-like HicB family nuclease